MIDEQRNLEIYGYTSNELKPKSQKPIVVVCENCGKYRVIGKYQYKDLCIQCSRSNTSGKNNGMYGRTGKNYPNYKPKIIKFCEICNKKFEVTLAFKNSKFCSRKCQCKWQSENLSGENSPIWKGGEITKICEICGNEYKVIKSRENKSKFCSKECHNKWTSINKCGINNGFYNKNHTLEARIQNSCAQQGIPIEDFNGFTHDQKYCSKFNNQLKTKIRNQYNNCDYISGLHKDICSPDKELSVHHVNYDKQCGCDGSQCELIPLCQSNHAKTNRNRIFWNQLFKYSLEIDKWYYKEEI